MNGAARPSGGGLLRLYPRAWRERYEDEMLALLEIAAIGWRGRVDLVRGALDARIHAESRVPGVAALDRAAGCGRSPAQASWRNRCPRTGRAISSRHCRSARPRSSPGRSPLIGCWARRSDRAGRRGAVVAIAVVISQLVWALALAAGFLGLADSATMMAGQAIGAAGLPRDRPVADPNGRRADRADPRGRPAGPAVRLADRLARVRAGLDRDRLHPAAGTSDGTTIAAMRPA